MTFTPITPTDFPWFDYQRYSFSLGLRTGGAEGKVVLSGHSASEYSPDRGRIVVDGDMRAQANTAYDKVERILEAAGLTLEDCVKVTENITRAGIDDVAIAAEVRRERVGSAAPAVNTICVDALLRPDALIEVAITAAPGGGRAVVADSTRPGLLADAPARAAEGITYLPSVLPVDDDGKILGEDLLTQTEAVYDRAARMLEDAGLAWSNVGFVVDFTTPDTLRDYKKTGRIRRDHLAAPYPGSAGILMSRLAHPGALIQLDLMASTAPLEAINPGWERYEKLTYSPAVRAGNVLFMSGQAALDPETEQAVHAGDIAAQAEYTYGNIITVLEAAGAGPEHLVETVEFVTPAGLPRYRETAAVRSRLLAEPYPSSTGIICQGLLRPEFELEVLPLAILDDAAAAGGDPHAEGTS
ncbi:RidA family protein [Euzebya tangerina]|uniref:RidA family protein n=1 Tax=Euzebya tangerina TaxID=591198 RepID=UPI000E30DDD4|nr:RidA family protein [Euzebya tangerina]